MTNATTRIGEPYFFLKLKNERKKELADKPGSVVDSHSSRIDVTIDLKQPTRTSCEQHDGVPIRSCSGWGLPCHACYQARGALLPHHFTLTLKVVNLEGGIFSVALAVNQTNDSPGVTWHPALWSPDFPPNFKKFSDCLANSAFSVSCLRYSKQVHLSLVTGLLG